LFGARGTGKSILLRTVLPTERALWIDLLAPEDEITLSESPQRLSQRIDALPVLPEWVVIDEVQKIPKLLDIVHHEIERRNLKFALTGSSARKPNAVPQIFLQVEHCSTISIRSRTVN
jgi:uncharacterized protein